MRKLFIIFALLVTSFLYANDGGKPQKGGILVFGRGGDSATLDPSHSTDGNSLNATSQIYDGLVQFKLGTTEVIPSLATSWDISRDGLTYTFYLRKGVKFHKTRYFKKKSKFTSKDVLFSFKRQMDSKYPLADGQPSKYWLAMGMSKIIKDIKADGKYKVIITLNQPNAPFLANIAMKFASILSKDYASELKKDKRRNLGDLGRKPIGTGPFIFKKWVKDATIKFKANKDYWNGRPYIDTLIFKVIPESSVRAAALKNGEIHIMDFPNPAEVKSLGDNKKIKLVKKEGLNIGFLAMNTKRKPFDNVKVRQAIRYAIDTKSIVNTLYAGLGVAAINPIPPGMWSFHEEIAKKNRYAYNVKKAKKLLKEAGYEKGFKATLWAMPVPRPYMPNARKVAVEIQSELAKINIITKIISYDWPTYLKRTSNGEHDMTLLGWSGDNGDPDNFLNVLLSKQSAKKPAQNQAFWTDTQFSNLTEMAKKETSISNRTSLYKAAQERFEDQTPWVPIAHSLVVIPMLKKVNGFILDVVSDRRFLRVWIEKKGKK